MPDAYEIEHDLTVAFASDSEGWIVLITNGPDFPVDEMLQHP